MNILSCLIFGLIVSIIVTRGKWQKFMGLVLGLAIGVYCSGVICVNSEAEYFEPDFITKYGTGVTVLVEGQDIYSSTDAEVYLTGPSNLVLKTEFGYNVWGRKANKGVTSICVATDEYGEYEVMIEECPDGVCVVTSEKENGDEE